MKVEGDGVSCLSEIESDPKMALYQVRPTMAKDIWLVCSGVGLNLDF